MISPGTQIGSYQIDRELGHGGMGVVYAGHDTRLDRAVAIKSLPPEFAGDELVRARFEREAKALAGLSHPNIAAVYGLEEQGGERYMVMELVEGETLTARLARGRIPVDEAIAVCAQVSAAIEAAHERGVIHRDIKPGNIMLAPDGRVKVLDFGLARQAEPPRAGTRGAADATVLASPATQIGKVVGTPGYMSPEQCRGKPLDKRTDIWSLGCVLYECLTGAMAFGGETESDSVAAILEREPDWTKLPDRTPVRVRELLKHCLEKDSKRRLRDAGDARLELERAITGREWTTTGMMTAASGKMPGSRRWLRLGLWAAVVVAAGAGWLAAWRATFKTEAAQIFHVSAQIPAKPSFGRLVGIAPDARFIVYSAWPELGPESTEPYGQLMMHRLDRDETRVIEGTAGVRSAALSADGRWLAFVAARDRTLARWSLKKVALTDGLAAGPPTTLCEDLAGEAGVYWASDRELVLTTGVPEPSILAVSSDGGPTRVVAREPAELGLRGWSSGRALPGGHEVLITHWELEGQAYKDQAEVIDLATGKRKTVLPNAGQALYIPTGHLVAIRDGTTVIAVPFDVSKMETTGGVVAILGGATRGGRLTFSTSKTGALAMFSQPPGAMNRRLAWIDDHGHATPIAGAARAFEDVSVSPDGGRVVCFVNSPNLSERPQELWVFDMSRGTMSRLPTQGIPSEGLWSLDGQRIAYLARSGDKPASIWERKADGTDEPVLLYAVPGVKTYVVPESWSPDGSTLALRWQELGASHRFVWLLRRPEGVGVWTAAPYLSGSASFGPLRFSPDGKWVSYRSDKSGRSEVYVQRFTGSAEEDAKAGQYQISTEGGGWDHWWSADGKEIRYTGADDDVMSVTVQTEPAFSATLPKKLYSVKDLDYWNATFASDGRLMAVLSGEGEQITRVDLVLNFFEELKQKLAAAGGK